MNILLFWNLQMFRQSAHSPLTYLCSELMKFHYCEHLILLWHQTYTKFTKMFQWEQYMKDRDEKYMMSPACVSISWLDGRFISWLYVPIFQMLRPQKTWEFYRLILIRKGKIYHSRTVEVIIHLSEAREDWNRGSVCRFSFKFELKNLLHIVIHLGHCI